MHPGQQHHTRKRLSFAPKVVVDVGMDCFRSHGCLRACSPTRRRESRTYGAMHFHSRPRPSAAALLVVRTQDEVPCARILRPSRSAHPATAIRNYGFAGATRRTTSFDRASAVRAKFAPTSEHPIVEARALQPETRFANVQRHVSPLLSAPLCCPTVVRMYPR